MKPMRHLRRRSAARSSSTLSSWPVSGITLLTLFALRNELAFQSLPSQHQGAIVARRSVPAYSFGLTPRQLTRGSGVDRSAGDLELADEEASVETQTEIKRSLLVQCWGALGVAAYLSYGVKKVVPIVVAGCGAIEFWWQWAFLVGTLFFFAYVEGYKGFQKGFSPRVVSRAWAVSERFDVPAGKRVGAREMVVKYGSAYLGTSILLSLFSITILYYLVGAGFDVTAFLDYIGLGRRVPGSAQKMGTFALAYALHKASSPIRFPPTVWLTTIVAGWMGKSVEETESPVAAGPLWHKVLAPGFCIGYFHGTKKRVISSWCVTTGIFAVVVGVKRLSNPYRAIIDAGVIVGLAWGVVSILILFAKSLKEGEPPKYDPSLPEGTPYTLV